MSIAFCHQAATQIMRRSSFTSLHRSTARLSAIQWAIAMVERVYPIIRVTVLMATALAAIIAIRMAAWLPMYLHQVGSLNFLAFIFCL